MASPPHGGDDSSFSLSIDDEFSVGNSSKNHLDVSLLSDTMLDVRDSHVRRIEKVGTTLVDKRDHFVIYNVLQNISVDSDISR